MNPIPIEPYAKVAARLLQGPLYDDETTMWHQLDQHFADVYRHFASVGLELSRHERDGLAFLQQIEISEDRDTVCCLYFSNNLSKLFNASSVLF